MNRLSLERLPLYLAVDLERGKKRKKKTFHFSLCTGNEGSNNDCLSGIIHDFFLSFLLYVFPPEIIFLIFMYYTFINDINKKLKNINIKARDLLKKKKMVLEGNRMKRTHKIY